MDTVHFLPQPSRELCSHVSATPAIRVGAVTNEDSSSKAARPIDRPEAPFVQARHPHCGPRSASSPVPLEPSFCFSSAGPACCDVHNRDHAFTSVSHGANTNCGIDEPALRSCVATRAPAFTSVLCNFADGTTTVSGRTGGEVVAAASPVTTSDTGDAPVCSGSCSRVQRSGLR